ENLEMNSIAFDEQTICGNFAFGDRHPFKVNVEALRLAPLIDAELHWRKNNTKVAKQLLTHPRGRVLETGSRYRVRECSTHPSDNTGAWLQPLRLGSGTLADFCGLVAALDLFGFCASTIGLQSSPTVARKPPMPVDPIGAGRKTGRQHQEGGRGETRN